MWLRRVLIVIGVLSMFGGAVAAARGLGPPAFWLLLNGLVLSAGVAWERWRYRQPDTRRPGPGWQRTGERFVDPETGQLTEVWYAPESGERRYVATAGSGGPD